MQRECPKTWRCGRCEGLPARASLFGCAGQRAHATAELLGALLAHALAQGTLEGTLRNFTITAYEFGAGAGAPAKAGDVVGVDAMATAESAKEPPQYERLVWRCRRVASRAQVGSVRSSGRFRRPTDVESQAHGGRFLGGSHVLDLELALVRVQQPTAPVLR